MGEYINPDLYLAVIPIHTMAILLALCSDVSTMIIIFKTPQLHTPSSSLMVILAISNLILSLVWNAIPVAVSDETIRARLPSSWWCVCIGVTWQVMMTILTLLHGLVALDRYFFIVHPMKYQVHVTIKRSLIIACAIFLTSCAVPGFLLLSGSKYTYSAPAMTCIGPPFWPIIFLVVIFTPSLGAILFSCHRVWKLCFKAIKHEFKESPSALSLPLSAQSSNLTIGKRKATNGDLYLRTNTTEAEYTLKHTENGEHGCKSSDHIMTQQITSHSTGLTTATTIAGTSFVMNPEEKVHNLSKKQFQESNAHLENQTLSTNQERPREICTRQYGVLAVNVISSSPSRETNVPIEIDFPSSPCRSSTAFIDTKATNSISDNPKDQMPSDTILNRDLDDSSLGIGLGPKILQLAVLVNPAISWILIQKWSTVDGSCLLASDCNLRRSSLSLQNKSTVRQHRLRQASFMASWRRWLRSFMMLMLPVFGMITCFLPLIFCLIFWEYSPDSHTDFSVIFCHFCYAIAPSAVSLFISLTSKPYRRALKRQMHCCLTKHI